MGHPGPRGTTTRAPLTADVVDGAGPVGPAVVAAAVEDLQGQAPDLGWPEASSLTDALVDALAHLLVDLGAGAATPTPRPAVIGALGGSPGPVDAASCRATAASLRRSGSLLRRSATAQVGWPGPAGDVALDLADLLEQVADQSRTGRLGLAHKGPVVRRLHRLHRTLGDL